MALTSVRVFPLGSTGAGVSHCSLPRELCSVGNGGRGVTRRFDFTSGVGDRLGFELRVVRFKSTPLPFSLWDLERAIPECHFLSEQQRIQVESM